MKRLFSLVLVLVLAVSLFAVIPVSATEDVPYAIQVARKDSVNGSPLNYSNFDWSLLGENLVPDPEVSHFDVGGEYGRYSKIDANFNPAEINTYYWWDKPAEPYNGFNMYYNALVNGLGNSNGEKLVLGEPDANGNRSIPLGNLGNVKKDSNNKYTYNGKEFLVALRSPLNWGAVKKPSEYSSITDDGSGVLRFNPPSSSGAYRHIPFPKMEAGKYYVIKFNVKCTTSNSGGIDLFLDDTAFNDETRDCFISMGESFAANGSVNVACFLVYTGSNTYENPLASIYLMAGSEVFFDDFGMYEVSAEYAAGCSEGKKLSESNPLLDQDPYGFQTSLDNTNKVIDYSDFDWSLFGENIVPDPTVANFENGVYGKYAIPDSNYNPTNINEYYWWDKYTNVYHGFTMYYQDMADGVMDNKNSNGTLDYQPIYRSASNWGFIKSPEDPDYKSLTDDGSGVIFIDVSGNKYLPLPTMEKYSYYVFKFNAKFKNSMHSEDFGIYSATNGSRLVNLNPKNILATGKTDTFTCLLYTGNNKYSNAVLRMYVNTDNELYFDDFGMYKVTEAVAKTCAEGTQLAEFNPNLSPTPEFIQTTVDETEQAIDYSDFDWSNYGDNLVPDPTVNNFVDDGDGGLIYGRYSKINSYFDPVEINEQYWWDKYIDVNHGFNLYYKTLVNGLGNSSGENIILGEADENGYRTIPLGSLGNVEKDTNGDYSYQGTKFNPNFRSPQNRGAVRSTGSLTNDGSGVLYDTASSANYKYYPLPQMKKYKYYLVKFNIKFQNINYSSDIYFYNNVQKISGQLLPMYALGKKTSTVTLVVYTGNNVYADPAIAIWLEKENTVSLDDFGVYELSEEYASWCSPGTKLADPPMEFTEPWAIQASRKPNGGALINYSDFDWSVFEKNLVTDPTVAAANFTNGVYGKYATPDENGRPTNINQQYWWDKYIEKYNGFTMYCLDMADGNFDKTVDDQQYEVLYRSPANRSGCVLNTGSLTNDGSGVLHDKSNYDYRAYPLPRMNSNSYYVIKFNIKFNGVNNDPVELCLVPDEDLRSSNAISSIMLGNALTSGTVYTMTFFVYTGSNVYTDPFIRIKIDNVDTYLDDFGMYKVSKNYAELCSEGEKLWDMQCDTTAFGYRNNDKVGTTCANSDNLVEDYDCISSEYWYCENGFATISNDYAYSGSTSLKVSGTGILKKRFTFEKNTEYYLALWGMGDGTPVSNINFGFMDVHGHVLKNPLSSDESSRSVFSLVAKEEITIQCQDGTWYNRVYKFNTMNVDTLDFFVTGTKGTLYLDDIRIFKKSNAFKNSEKIDDLTTNTVSKYNCAEQYNIIPNGDFSHDNEFWCDFVGYGESVNIITSDNNSVLHFKGSNNYCYYLPYVTVESGVSYTYTYWAKNISGSNTKYGIVSLNNPKGFISEPVSITSNVGTWKRYTVSFTAHTETKIAFAIFDVDGEAVFDDFKLFKTKNGTTSASETPTDPSFAWTYLSITNGKKNEYRQQYENVDWNDYGEKVYSNSNVQTSSTLDNGKKYKRISTSSLTKYNYYMVSYSLTVDSSADVTINHYCTDQSNSFNSTTVNFSEPGSKEVSMIFCTGPNSGNPNFEIGSDADFQVSNINIYKITDKELGRLCIKEKRLIILGDLDYNLILDYVDLINLRRNVLEETYSDSLLLNDVNSDSIIDVRDVVRIKKKIIK